MEAFEQLIEQIAPNLYAYRDRFFTSFAATFEMFAKAGIIAFVVGLFFGVLLVITRKGGVRQNLVVYQIVNIVINVFRSIPFIILLIFLIPLTRAVVGTAMIGTHLFFVGATPSSETTSSNSGFLMIMPIAFAVSIEEPPPMAMMQSAPDFLKAATPALTLATVGLALMSE